MVKYHRQLLIYNEIYQPEFFIVKPQLSANQVINVLCITETYFRLKREEFRVVFAPYYRIKQIKVYNCPTKIKKEKN